MIEPMDQLFRRAARMKRDGRQVVACLLASARGSTPQSAGALMLVDDAANTFGTIGGGCVEAEIRRRAHQMMSERASGVLSFKLDHDFGWDDGLICGGTINLVVAPLPATEELESIADAIEHRRETSLDLVVDDEDGPQRYTLELPPRERVYIAGAGHVGQALARLAHRLEFDVTMFDDRADLLERFTPEGVKKAPGDIAGELKIADIDDRTYCIIVTRGHKHDEQALAAVIERGARYVGMIGSRRKVKLIYDDLREMGVSESALEKVHAPIGLDLGSVTVEEIAMSIAGQLVQVRRSDFDSPVRGPVPLDRMTDDASTTAAPGS